MVSATPDGALTTASFVAFGGVSVGPSTPPPHEAESAPSAHMRTNRWIFIGGMASRNGFWRQVAFHVDTELAAVKAANAPVLDPLLGDLVQDPALLFPIHKVPGALNGESQLIIVLDQAIQLRYVLTSAEPRVELSANDQRGDRELGRHIGVPSREDGLSYSHHAVGRAPRAAKLVVLHDRRPNHVFDAGLPLTLTRAPTGGAAVTREQVRTCRERHRRGL